MVFTPSHLYQHNNHKRKHSDIEIDFPAPSGRSITVQFHDESSPLPVSVSAGGQIATEDSDVTFLRGHEETDHTIKAEINGINN